MRFCTKGCFLNLTGEKIPLNRILLLTQTMSQRHFIKMALEKMMGLSRMMVKIILGGRRSRAGLAKVGCLPGGGGHSHTLPILVCAAQRGRDFEAPNLERGIHFRGVF